MGEKIEIDRDRLEELYNVEKELRALEAAGVDNWQGYVHAMDILRECEEETK